MLTPTFWKVFSGVLVLCILVQQFSLRSSSFKPRHIFGPSASTKAPASKASSHPSTDVGSWTFDWTRDGNNHGLSSGQCDAAFPDLYSEIDRAVDFWERKEITPELIDMYGGASREPFIRRTHRFTACKQNVVLAAPLGGIDCLAVFVSLT